MLAALPLTTARDRLWWSHCLPWGHLTCRQVSLQDSSKKGQWACHTHQWFQLQLVESNRLIVKKVVESNRLIVKYFRNLSVSASVATLPGLAALCSGFQQTYPQFSRPIQGSCRYTKGSESNETIRSSISRQAHSLQDRGETNAGQ